MAQHAVDVHAERDVLSRQMPAPAAIGMNAATDILDLPAAAWARRKEDAMLTEWAEGHREQALTHMRRAHELNPENVFDLLSLIEGEYALGNHSNVVALLALRFDNRSPAVPLKWVNVTLLLRYAHALQAEGGTAEAKPLLEAVLAESHYLPRRADLAYPLTAAEAFMLLGRFEEALDASTHCTPAAPTRACWARRSFPHGNCWPPSAISHAFSAGSPPKKPGSPNNAPWLRRTVSRPANRPRWTKRSGYDDTLARWRRPLGSAICLLGRTAAMGRSAPITTDAGEEPESPLDRRHAANSRRPCAGESRPLGCSGPGQVGSASASSAGPCPHPRCHSHNR
jgi:hypothetical protein